MEHSRHLYLIVAPMELFAHDGPRIIENTVILASRVWAIKKIHELWNGGVNTIRQLVISLRLAQVSVAVLEFANSCVKS